MRPNKGKKPCGFCGVQPGQDHTPRCDEFQRATRSIGVSGHYFYYRDAADAEYYGWEEVEEDDYSENSFP